MTEDKELEIQNIIKDYLKKNLEVHVELDNDSGSKGYIYVKVIIKLDGEKIDSSRDATWICVTE